MRRTGFLLILCACCAQHVFGQSDYSKRELGANASIVGADTKGAFNNDKSRDGLYGLEVHGAYNISRYLGLKADFSYFRKRFEAGPIFFNARLTQVMGGIKVQDNANSIRFRPFAHALVGVAHTSDLPFVVQDSSAGRLVSVSDDTGLAFALGGGLDIRLTKKFELRAFQIDYNPSRIKGDVFQNVRLGIGVNFRF